MDVTVFIVYLAKYISILVLGMKCLLKLQTVFFHNKYLYSAFHLSVL